MTYAHLFQRQNSQILEKYIPLVNTGEFTYFHSLAWNTLGGFINFRWKIENISQQQLKNIIQRNRCFEFAQATGDPEKEMYTIEANS